ncbi:MAG: hypothetical protein R2748_26255 [Bryobacterales bacterium]
MAAVVVGHMTACALGGWLAGLGIENDLKTRANPRPRRNRKALQDAA